MLIREGDQRSLDIDVRLAALLAGIAGAVNAAGFQATGFFSANMTGNVSALSDYFGLGKFGQATFFGSLVVAFIAGAFGSGLLIELGRRQGVKAIYAYSITVEAGLLVVVGIFDVLFPISGQGMTLIVCLSFIMGIQNAASTRISHARVRTTHVSGMATDIGLGLAALVVSPPDRPSAVARLKLYSSTIIAFMLGGIVGVCSYVMAGGALFIAAAAVLIAVAVPQVLRAKKM
ncbi:YoaK family protein [Aminobacter sp. HY435]|uniref:YoaK family protein n=1 Tax=Aminobacter sp. HY435 TaxID=2970917 RepID=UPI0022B9B509|nr:YoaK family protein [Aminobacter sp. HY435]